MTIVTEENFHSVYSSLAEKFWSEVYWFVASVLDGDRALVQSYEITVRNAPIDEQILTYHDTPLSVALDLVGQRALTESQLELLSRIGGEKWRAISGQLGETQERSEAAPRKKPLGGGHGALVISMAGIKISAKGIPAIAAAGAMIVVALGSSFGFFALLYELIRKLFDGVGP